jgi:hypothetical protein
MKWLKRIWCDWTHGGGKLSREINDCINWQCSKCGRWAIAVDKKTESYIVDKAIKNWKLK